MSALGTPAPFGDGNLPTGNEDVVGLAVTPAPRFCHAGVFSGVSLGFSHVVSPTYENLLPGLLRGATSGFLSTPAALLLAAGTGEGAEGRVVVAVLAQDGVVAVLAQDDASADVILTLSPAHSTGVLVAKWVLDDVSEDGVLTSPSALSTGGKGWVAVSSLDGVSADSMLTVSTAFSTRGTGEDGLVAVLTQDGVSGDGMLTGSSALSTGGSGDDGLIVVLAQNVSADGTLTVFDGTWTAPARALSPRALLLLTVRCLSRRIRRLTSPVAERPT